MFLWLFVLSRGEKGKVLTFVLRYFALTFHVVG